MTETRTDHQAMVDMSYEPFAQEPVYLGLNAEFVATIPLAGATRVLDLACGTGVVSGLVVDRILADGGRPEVVGVDLSAESLRLGEAAFATRSDRARFDVRLLQGRGEEVPVPDGWADVVTVGNAIHLFDDLSALLTEVHRATASDGVLAFNTSFYAGTFGAGTEGFYTEWMRQALARLAEEDARRRQAGLGPLRRRKGGKGTAFQRPWLAPDEYVAAVAEHGFEVESVRERTVPLGQSELEAIGGYAGLAAVLLSGYPVEVATAALVAGVRPALDAVAVDVVPRGWLEIVARRR